MWPPGTEAGPNPYLKLLTDAMAEHGVTYRYDLKLTNDSLRELATSATGIHVQWPETLWRYSGQGRLSAYWRIRYLQRFFRWIDLAVKLGYRIVWTVHNTEHHEGAGWIDRLGYRKLRQKTDLFIFHSNAARDSFVQTRRIDPQKTLVARHGNYAGVYPNPKPRESTRASLDFPQSARVLLSCGIIRPYKGIETAIDALVKLGDRYRLLIVGENYVSSYLEQLTKRIGGNPAITVVSRRVDEQEFADLHEAADCVLLPYRAITGSGALLASLTLGRGVVASDLPFFREYLSIDSIAGELFETGDSASLANAIEKYFEVGIDKRSFAARAIAAHCDWKVVTQAMAREMVRLSTKSK